MNKFKLSFLCIILALTLSLGVSAIYIEGEEVGNADEEVTILMSATDIVTDGEVVDSILVATEGADTPAPDEETESEIIDADAALDGDKIIPETEEDSTDTDSDAVTTGASDTSDTQTSEEKTPDDKNPSSGKCGDNVNYTLDKDGVLIVSGKGKMYDLKKGAYPWSEYSSSIKKVIIKNGVTSIGRYAFADCENLESAEIPEGTSEIGYMAFSGCDKLKIVCVKESNAENYARAENIPYDYSDGSSSFGGDIEVMVICGVIAVICAAVIAYVWIRYRSKKSDKK